MHRTQRLVVKKQNLVAQQLSYYVCVLVIHNTFSLGPLALVSSAAHGEAVFSIILGLFLQSFTLHPRSAFTSHFAQVIRGAYLQDPLLLKAAGHLWGNLFLGDAVPGWLRALGSVHACGTQRRPLYWLAGELSVIRS